MPVVLNKRDLTFPRQNQIYVGRPSKFGNPFAMTTQANRDSVCDKFEEWIKTKPELIEATKKELKGKDLVCYCAPARCHADTLLRIANE